MNPLRKELFLKKTSSIVCLSLLLLLTILGIIWTQDLEQVNKETIFLSSESQSKYQNFQKKYNVRSFLVSKFKKKNKVEIVSFIKGACGNICQVFDKDKLPENNKLRLVHGDEEALIIFQNEGISDIKFKNKIKEILISDLGKTLSSVGVPYTNILLDEYSKKIKTTLFPALFAGVFFLLFFFLKNLIYAAIVFTPGLMASSLSLSTTKFFLKESNLITSIVPLLLFVIQMSLVLHVHFTAREFKSLRKALKDKREPVFLMVGTTFIGFGSLYFSDLQAISHFGIMTASLLLSSTFFTSLWLFLFANSFDSLWGRGDRKKPLFFKETLHVFWSKKKIFVFFLITFLIGGLSLTKIPIVTDATKYFPESTEIRKKMISLSQNFLGIPLVEIIVPWSKKEFEYSELKKIFEKEKILSQKLKGPLLSSNQFVVMANHSYTGKKILPSHKFAYFTLRSQIPPTIRDGLPIDEGSGYRMTYLGEPMNVDDYEKVLSTIQEVFGENVQFNGLYYHLMLAQKKMLGTLFKSFFLSLLLIALIIFFYFKNIRLFFIFMAINLLPVFASFPFFWILGLSFNIATVMTYSISLGLVVDSSFHIVHTLNDPNKSKEFLVESVLTPIVAGSVLLAICFFLFSLVDFLPIKEFGIGLGIVILLGMILDLKVLPTLYRPK